MTRTLQGYAEESSTAPVAQVVTALAQSILPLHLGTVAMLAYGSALRDASPEETLIDYYVLTHDLKGVSKNGLSRALCSAVPPNVYYVEALHNGKLCRAKYAVLPLPLLAEKVGGSTSNPYFWARFCQPMRLVHCVSPSDAQAVFNLLGTAMQTAANHARSLAPMSEARDQWVALFRKTYATELRPESQDRASLIVDMQIQHFDTISALAAYSHISATSWPTRVWQGKLLSLARLLKAAFTFQGGVDYAAWKIKRHSGVEIEIKDWHRRHPVLASVVLLPNLLRRGGIK